MNIYLELTREFNAGGLRAIVSSGQAVVLHRLAVMSKDGDWILREDEAALQHVLRVLERRQARYRFGAPLDVRWMRGGWSAHFEFRLDPLRIRTDFVTRPPRLEVTRDSHRSGFLSRLPQIRWKQFGYAHSARKGPKRWLPPRSIFWRLKMRECACLCNIV